MKSMNESYKHLRKDSQTDPQNSGYKNAQTLRGEAIQHKEKGGYFRPPHSQPKLARSYCSIRS